MSSTGHGKNGREIVMALIAVITIAIITTATAGLSNQLPIADSKGPYNGTEGVAITFNGGGSYDPDGAIVSYAWNFGDGNNCTSTELNTTHTYEQDGTYNVTLVVTDNECATDTNTTTATIDDTEPTADFAGTPTSGLKPLTVVNFSDSSTSYDAIAAWEWDFGDGDTSTEQNPTHVYATEGSYTVSLTVYEADGDSDTGAKVDYINVTQENQPPVSDPNGPYTGTEGAAILFSGSGSYDPDGSIASYAWDFGDGNTGTGESPAYTYAQDGTYNVTLVVTDNEGATDTNTTTATIADTEPTADFAGTPTSGLKPLTVNFSDSSTSYEGITAWEWDFGDGNTSTEQNPTHVYATEGCYTVSLTGYEADGDIDIEAKVDYINVTRENQPPVSDPNGPYTGTEGVAITFSGSGSYDPDGSIISFAWDFGFGDGNTGTGESPAYTYAQDGTYNVTLVVTDNEGATDTNTTTATIADTEPTADFAGMPTSGLKPLIVNFTDSSTSYDGITAWEWDFGDGDTSTEQNPTHMYTTEGCYAVSLTVYEADGDSDTEAKVDYIIVTRENQLPVSDPNGPYSGTEGAAILFSGSGSYDPDGSIISYVWDFGFGDGNTGTGESPAYTYAQDGTYNVTLVVTDNEGATDTKTTTATIADTEPTADFSATPASGLKPLTVDFADSSTSYDGITAWRWDFGDGNTSTEQNPTHVYATEGTYTISLTVYEADDDSDTEAKVDYIIVTLENQLPVSDLNGPYTGTEGVALTFSGSGSYDPDGSIISFAWDFGFGDGNTGTGESPAYTYAQGGTYNVTLVVTDSEDATDTNATTATIADTEPTADFSATPASGLKPLTVNLSDSSSSYDAITAWGWDFGDGNTSTEQNPTHMYTTEGIYTVSLTVYEADGDSDTEAKVDYINVTRENQPPVSDLNGPYTGTEGAAITFSGSGSYDPDGSIISFAWDFGFGDGNTGTGESPAYTYAQNGIYNVTLVVTDNEGATDTNATTATIDDTEPIADFAGTPTSGLKPLTVDFSDSSTSYDGITAWEWDFGDGDTSTEQNPTHVYATEGCYTVSLTVYEADGDSDTKAKVDYINVTRENQPPVSDPNGPYSGTEGVAITFSGSGSYDPDGSIISFAWDFGDGNNCTSTEMNTTHTYAQDGTYNVTLVVTDNEGATDTNATTANIDDTEPIANLSFEINPSGINFGAVVIGIEKIVFTTITNTGNCPAKVTVTKNIMKGMSHGDTIPVSALGVNGNYVDNPVIVSSSLGCNESVTLNLSIQVPVGTLADTYTKGFTITVCHP